MAKVTFEFDLYEEADDLDTFMQSKDMSMALNEIYNQCRSLLKHSADDLDPSVDAFIERIKEYAGEFV